MDGIIRDRVVEIMAAAGVADSFDISVRHFDGIYGVTYGVEIARRGESIGGVDYLVEPSKSLDANMRDIDAIGAAVVQKCRECLCDG